MSWLLRSYQCRLTRTLVNISYISNLPQCQTQGTTNQVCLLDVSVSLKLLFFSLGRGDTRCQTQGPHPSLPSPHGAAHQECAAGADCCISSLPSTPPPPYIILHIAEANGACFFRRGVLPSSLCRNYLLLCSDGPGNIENG
ncbi:hypothetical protein DUNSADRAFT_1382 [Dunaliella salina]|uniref:Uncharacterized protein n=1 Tax=Dunaliella salina TaxID=3046 RepID=A0ABQ7FXI2_DUNSA|nr:hypothetical protein DUNSADRAFT_1382 [Dunaliella salina]|eukprot:KAF5827072.1 hypothetical protein DUNSADRAFT_1382 [Dunaliella salina]